MRAFLWLKVENNLGKAPLRGLRVLANSSFPDTQQTRPPARVKARPFGVTQ